MITRGRVLLAVFITMLALAAPASAATQYVSLGDSYAAGPLIPLQIPPFGCLKSNNNYSHLTARQLGLRLTDPSCSGAETEDMTNPQGVDPDGPNPPQFNSLTTKTDVVTIQIGGNDIAFEIAEDCTAPRRGHSLQDRYVHDAVRDHRAHPRGAARGGGCSGDNARSPRRACS